MASGVTFYGRISTNVISHYFHNQVWDGITNNRPAFMAMKKRGHIETGLDGTSLTWNVQGGRHTAEAYDEAEAVTITRKKHEFQCVLPWAFYKVTDAITRDEIAMASGDAAIFRLNKNLLERMKTNFETRLNSDYMNKDGMASATNVFHGMETFLGCTGATTSKTATMSDTYAGQSTALSGITSIDNAESDAWTPTGIFTNSSAFASTGNSFRSNCRQMLSYGIDQLTKGNQATDRPDLITLERSMFSDLKDVLASSQRLIVNGSPQAGTTGLGIPGAIEYDGVDVIFDADCASGVGYIQNMHHAYLDVLKVPELTTGGNKIPGGGSAGKDDMFEVLVDEDISSNGVLVRVNFRGQLRFHPRYFGKLLAG